MQIFNIFVSEENNHIWVNFETIGCIESLEERDKCFRNNWNPTILALVSSEYAYNGGEIIKKRLLRNSTCEFLSFTAMHQTDVLKFTLGSSQYRLPYQRQTALDFLAIIQTYLENMNFNHVLVSDASILTKIKSDQLIIPIDEYLKEAISPTENSISALIANKILGLKCQNKYYLSALAAINKIYAICFYSKQEDFQENLAVKRRFYILNILTEEFNQIKTEKDLIEKVFLMLNKLYSSNREEFFHLAGNLELEMKKALYKPCLGKIAHDGQYYLWSYTEWGFIKNAKFILKDNKFHIYPKQQKGYEGVYSSGCYNHQIFKAEMEHLAKIINLQFEPNCDFHQEIILTAECSKRLIQQGFHLCDMNISEIINPNKGFGIFSDQYEIGHQNRLFSLMQKMTALITENELTKVENILHGNNNSASLKEEFEEKKYFSLVG